MVVFPNCKINIGLQILDKRPDGYHNLETVFYPVPLIDALEIIRNPDVDTKDNLTFSQTGLTVDGDATANLCHQAFELINKDFSGLPPLKMHLHKAIPMGAGLGGGSSDGAHTLLLLNKLFNLQISQEQLIAYALKLGSDCPFFILNEPCFATGRGELLTPLKVRLKGYHLMLVNPGIHLSTAKAFKSLYEKGLGGKSNGLYEAIQLPINTWRYSIRNDFEESVLAEYPELKELSNQFYEKGALYAAMSGSGSTFFALFKDRPSLLSNLPTHWKTYRLEL